MRVESMVIRKYYRFSANTKLNAKSWSIPLNTNWGMTSKITHLIFNAILKYLAMHNGWSYHAKHGQNCALKPRFSGECEPAVFQATHAQMQREYLHAWYNSGLLKSLKVPLMCMIQLLSHRKRTKGVPLSYCCQSTMKERTVLAAVLIQRNRFLWRGFYLIPYSRQRWETWLIWGLLPMHKEEKRRGNWHSNASPINFYS